MVAALALVAGVSLTCTDSTPAAPGLRVTPMATSIPLPDSPPPPPPTGSVGGIDVAVDSRGPGLLSPGSKPLVFTVTLTNTTSADIPQVGLTVSFGQCPCGYPDATVPPPAASMYRFDPNSLQWVSAPFVTAGVDDGPRYLVPPFTLNQGQTVTYHLEMQLDPGQPIQQPPDSDGSSRINVAITTPSARGHAATLLVAVKP